MLPGIAGLHALQQERITNTGWLGFFTVIVAFLGQAFGTVAYLVGGPLFSDFVVFLTTAVDALVVMGGFVLYSEATMRANVLPFWCGVVLTMGTGLSIALGPNIGNVLFGLFWLAFAYLLLQRAQAYRPSGYSS